jgi:hypothetical protein
MNEIANELKHRRTITASVQVANSASKADENNNSNNTSSDLVLKSENFEVIEKKILEDKQQQTVDSSATRFSAENACWLVAALLSIYASNMYNVLIYDGRVYR